VIAESISFVLRNLPAFLLVIALLVAALHRGRWSTPERFLSWLLLLPVGVTARGPPGATAFTSFWCGLPFKAAAVWASSIFLLGDAVGHVHQMLAAGNFAPGNAGVPFFMDIICPMLTIALLAASWRHYRAGMVLRRSV
jgi:hypothetical protein